MHAGLLTLTLTVLLAHLRGAVGWSNGWYFYWPSVTHQCESILVYIYGGTPPWTLAIIPIGGRPITWQIDAPLTPANLTEPAIAGIPVSLPAGTAYTVVMADENGFNGGSSYTINPKEIQVVLPSETGSDACLNAVEYVPQEFTFGVQGQATECSNDFGIGWLDTIGRSPYYFSVIPLDTGYWPWNVQLRGGADTPVDSSWIVNMTVGTRFTIVMGNANGWGRGGVGGIYEVVAGETTNCLTQTWQATLSWPSELTTTSLPATVSIPSLTVSAVSSAANATAAATLDPAGGSVDPNDSSRTTATEKAGDSTEGSSSGSNGLATGALVGVIIGSIVGAAALIAALVAYLWRRRKQRAAAASQPGNVDLIGTIGPSAEQPQYKVDPYREAPPSMGYGEHLYSAVPGSGGSSSGWGTPGVTMQTIPGSMATAGFAGVGADAAAAAASDARRHSTSSYRPSESSHDHPPEGYFSTSMHSPVPSSPLGPGQSSPITAQSHPDPYPPHGATAAVPFLVPQLGYSSTSAVPSAGDDRVKSMYSASENGGGPSSAGQVQEQEPEFVMHTDGGEVPGQQQPPPPRERIDMPPLYSQVPSARQT